MQRVIGGGLEIHEGLLTFGVGLQTFGEDHFSR